MGSLQMTGDTLLRVANPKGRNNATTPPDRATPVATTAQPTSLKALALLALRRNNTRNDQTTDLEKPAQQTEHTDAAPVAYCASTSAALRTHLLALADSEGIDPMLVQRISPGELAACTGLPNDTLRAYVRALHDRDQRERGKVPPDETAAALCRHCGPIWLHPVVARAAPVVGGWPRLLGCPWCHVRNRAALTRPLVTCGACTHFIRDAINPAEGMGHCSAECNPTRPWPNVPRQCAAWRPRHGP